MNLQSLFSEPIVRQTKLGNGHASDVWFVATAREELIVRSSVVMDDSDHSFVWGCWELFGIQLRNTFDMERINCKLLELNAIPVPRIHKKAMLDNRQFVVLDKMPGDNFVFFNQPDTVLEQFGQSLALLHKETYDCIGNIQGTYRYPLEQFHRKLIQSMHEMVNRYFPDHPELRKLLDPMCALAEKLDPPRSAAIIMVDMDSRQFLCDGTKVTAMVDTEACAIAPRELDFIALEYAFNEKNAKAFRNGYAQVLPLPVLSQVRPVYRFLYRLLEIQGPVDVVRWMNSPAYFD